MLLIFSFRLASFSHTACADTPFLLWKGQRRSWPTYKQIPKGLCKKKEVSIEAILWKVVPMEIPTSNDAKNNFLNLLLVCLPVKISKRPL